MTGPAYPAARAAARRIQNHFSEIVAGIAGADVLENVISTAFWASLRREEGYAPKVSIALVPPEFAGVRLMFQTPMPFVPDVVTRVAVAAQRPGIHLGVWQYGEELCIWGTTRVIPIRTFVLEVVSPGLLVIKHRRSEDSAKFVNLVVLEGEQIKVLDADAARSAACPKLVSALLGCDPAPSGQDSLDVLVELAVSMRLHGRGGSLLVVPSGSDAWRNSILQPVRYPVSPPFSELADLVRNQPQEKSLRQWKDTFRRAVETIAGLTAVDGATIVTYRYEVLAFGAKISRTGGASAVERVIVTEPIQGAAASVEHIAQLGGTRHFSAAQFAQDQPDCLALVASQDGRFTVFQWAACEAMVHAHRIEALLM